MSAENVEVFLQRAVAATNRGDMEAVLRELHPEVEFHAFMEELLGGEGSRGTRVSASSFVDFNESFDQLYWEYPDIRDLGDRVLAIGTFRARGRGSGAEAETPLGVMVEFKGGVGTVVLSTADPRDALEAAGLSE